MRFCILVIFCKESEDMMLPSSVFAASKHPEVRVNFYYWMWCSLSRGYTLLWCLKHLHTFVAVIIILQWLNTMSNHSKGSPPRKKKKKNTHKVIELVPHSAFLWIMYVYCFNPMNYSSWPFSHTDRCQALQDFTSEREGRPHLLHLHGQEQQKSFRPEEQR